MRWVAGLMPGMGMAATLYTPAFAVVTRRFPMDFRRAIITITFLGGLASTVFIPLFCWCMAQWGWRQALWLLVALQWGVCWPLHHWLLKDAPPPGDLSRIAPLPNTELAPPRTLQAHLRHSPFWLLALFMVLMMAVTSALPAHMIALLQESGLSPVWVIAIPAATGALWVAQNQALKAGT